MSKAADDNNQYRNWLCSEQTKNNQHDAMWLEWNEREKEAVAAEKKRILW